MIINVIQSGSKGNATIVEVNGRILLIDMGITLKALNTALESMDKKLIDIRAMLLTHEHSDHTKGIKYLGPIPIYCGEKTYDSLDVIIVNKYETFFIDDIKITPFKAYHDAVNPLGFIIEGENEKLVYVTDTGYMSKEAISYTKNATYYVFESNHDVKMLEESGRPKRLIDRIKSRHGHLSNDKSANFLVKLIGPNTKEVVLAHLSEDCNKPEIALETQFKILRENNINFENIRCASQREMTIIGK